MKKGAEASLFLEEWHGRKVVMKRRLEKKYRLSELDAAIRSQRTLHEPQLIHRAKEAGVPTPTVFLVDVTDANIIMEYINGEQVSGYDEIINFRHLKNGNIILRSGKKKYHRIIVR